MEIIISSSTSKPIYEQITSQIKQMVMTGELQSGDPIPSIRALAKDIHVSVITVKRAYDDLARDGFIHSVSGKGSFIAPQNTDFIKEEKQKQVEQHLMIAVDIAKTNAISLQTVIELLEMFYEEEY